MRLTVTARSLGALLWMASASSIGFAEDPDEGNGLPLIFQDDFENGRSRWENTDEASWDIVDREGNHTFAQNKRVSDYTPKVRSPHNIALIRDLRVDDFALTFRVRSINDTGNHRDCCIFFGHQDPEHFYYIHLGAKPDPASGQIMIVDGAPRKPLTENTKVVPWDDAWHTVKVTREGATGKIAVYFDDMQTPHMSVIDRTFGGGRIGIGSFDDMNEFDDVRLHATKMVGEASDQKPK